MAASARRIASKPTGSSRRRRVLQVAIQTIRPGVLGTGTAACIMSSADDTATTMWTEVPTSTFCYLVCMPVHIRASLQPSVSLVLPEADSPLLHVPQ